ncbi:MAG: MFS transporter [Candidatus Methylacidiphilales bacterium]|nr:MFS transporter [Candidatus Methylacidiphilales bacterium]
MIHSDLFRTEDGKNRLVTFILVSSLFLLWGFLNGMIDVMDKHFQEELGLNLSQSAWVQFAHYLGYFLMALPAGWLASKLGYKGGIITGLVMVAAGGFWFIAATHLATFWSFLLGVCFIASGLTFLETVANPYTTVLGPKQFAATRINLAQSCNGIGWIFGPIAGAMFFYSTDAQGHSTGAQTLWIPYAAVGVIVLVLALIFWRVELPDIKTTDDYHMDEADVAANASSGSGMSALAVALVWANLVVLAASFGMIFTAIAAVFDPDESHGLWFFLGSTALAFVISAFVVGLKAHRFGQQSIWSHPHFSSATLTQFFYVAAQSGIFAYFINYMTSQTPVEISNKTASTLASVGFVCFLVGRFTGAALLKKFPAHHILGLYAAINVLACLLVMLKWGWVSVVAVFLSYFFMSIMFPTIFALGIHGLGARAKRASSYIVMAIMGGAIVPKLMGHVADEHGMSTGFVVPLVCFLAVAAYGFNWVRLSGSSGVVGLQGTKGH